MVRHRLSLAGNRKLNYALHMVATCQASGLGFDPLPRTDQS